MCPPCKFIVGTVLVIIFVLVAILGPEVATHNPYLRDRIQTIDGELHRTPIPPCALYPLGTDSEGRDMLSLCRRLPPHPRRPMNFCPPTGVLYNRRHE